MKTVCRLLLALAGHLLTSASGAPLVPFSAASGRADLMIANSAVGASKTPSPTPVTVTQDFSSNPLAQGWKQFGDASLFRWDEANQNLQVTWDSSRSNSYLQLPLGTIMSRSDDFRVELDLLLHDIHGGVDPTKPGPMQLAFGFHNRADAESPNFNRGTGAASPNLVEFNFFPDTGFGPTIWPAVYSTNSSMNYGGNGDFSIFHLPTGTTMHIILEYASSNQTVMTSITTNAMLVGPVTAARMATNSTGFGGPFTQFKVDTLAISSYSDLALPPGPYAGSLLAHGAIDNLVLTFPAPPIRCEQTALVGGEWTHSFLSRTNWRYSLQATTNLEDWIDVDATHSGTGGPLTFHDPRARTFQMRFYRINAQPNF